MTTNQLCQQCSEMTESYKTVIIVRKDLELPIGKWIAQAVHAHMRSVTTSAIMNQNLHLLNYHDIPAPICIVCYVKNEKQLLKLEEKVKAAGVPCGLQRDVGHNFVAPGTPTVLCIGPARESVINPLTKRLQLL